MARKEEPAATWSDATWADDSSAAEGAAEVDTGDLAVRYVEQAPVGEGGIGRVVRVLDLRFGREVALKTLKPGASERSVRRFHREARITAQLEHPGIVPVYDRGEEDGQPFYTMQLVRGRSLAQELLLTRTLEDRLALLDTFVAAGQAVAYAHSRGVVHRDLKPDNIMIGEFGETLVVDWGASEAQVAAEKRPIELADEERSVARSIVGTPAYMSPEQARGGRVDARSDVFSLGGILFTMLTGRPPHGSGPAMEVLARAADQPVPPAISLEPAAPSDLAAVATKALALDPADRYPDAASLVDEVQRWRRTLPVRAYSYRPWEVARLFVSRNRSLVALAVLASLVLVASVAAGWWRTRVQRDEAIAQAERAERALSAALAERARRAVSDGEVLRGRLLAAEAMRHGESPYARGLLASGAHGFTPERLADLDVGCRRLERLPGGEALLCVSPGHLRRIELSPPSIVWDVAIDPLVIHASASPGGERVAIGGQSVRILDAASGAVLDQHWTGESIRSTTFAADGTLYGFDRDELFWVDDEGVEGQAVGPSSLFIGAWQHGSTLRVISVNGSFSDLDALTHELTVPRQRLEHLVYAAATDEQGSVYLAERWIDILNPDGTRGSLQAGDAPLLDVDIAGDFVAAGDSRGRTWIWSRADGRIVAVLPSLGDHAAVRFLDGDTLVTSHVGAGLTRVWHLPAPTTPQGHDLGVGLASLDLSPDGQRLLLCGGDQLSTVYDLTSFTSIWRRQDGTSTLQNCAWLDGERFLAGPVAEADRTSFQIRDARTGHPLTPVADGAIHWVSPIGTDAVLHSDSETMTLARRVDGSTIQQRRIPADTHFAAGHLWYPDAEGRTMRQAVTAAGFGVVEPTAMRGEFVGAASPSGPVAVQGAGAVRVHADPAEPASCSFELIHTALVTFVGGERMVVAEKSGRITVRHSADCSVIAELDGHDQYVSAVVEGADGMLYTAGWDGRLRRWDLSRLDLDPEQVARELGARTGLGIRDGRVAPIRSAPAGERPR